MMPCTALVPQRCCLKGIQGPLGWAQPSALLPFSGFLFASKKEGARKPPHVSEMSAGLLDGTKSRLLDPRHQVVAMQRFIELFRVDVERDAYFGVASDLAYPYGVQARPDDQMRGERPTQVVRGYGRTAFANDLQRPREASLVSASVRIQAHLSPWF